MSYHINTQRGTAQHQN